MKKLILTICILAITGTAWAGVPTWPMTEQQQYEAVAQQYFNMHLGYMLMCILYDRLYQSTGNYYYKEQANEAITTYVEMGETANYYYGKLKYTVPINYQPASKTKLPEDMGVLLDDYFSFMRGLTPAE